MTAPNAETLWSRLGVPRVKGNGKFVGATTIDSIGTGLILAFTVLYFVKTTSVSLEAIGAAMTLARLLALPTAVVVGPLIDRFTGRRTATVGNLISAVGYGGFFLADNPLTIGFVVFLVQVGHTTYWTSSGTLVALAAPESVRGRWFGFIYALRNIGIGVGGALGAFAFGLGEVAGLHLITLANAISYVVAAGLLLLWHPKPHDEPAAEQAEVPESPGTLEAAEAAVAAEAPPTPAKASYATVLRDHNYTALVGVNVTLVFAQMLIKVLLAIYIVEALDQAAWIAGTLIVLSTIQIALTQTIINRRMERFRPTRVITTAALLNASAFALFALLYLAPNWIVVVGLFVAMTVFTFGEIIGFPAIDNLSVGMAEERIRGRYLAVYQLSWTIGEVVAPGVLTFLLARGAVLPMIFLLVLSLAALPLLAVLERKTIAGRVPAVVAS